MTTLEGICLGIVLLYFVPRVRLDPTPERAGVRLLLIALAAWAGEASCVHLYDFYTYAAEPWSLVLPGGVPLLVPLIWPVVIHSAYDLVRRLDPTGRPLRRVGLVAAVVVADASLIEPVAVHAGLWSWSEPGLFGVPPVGVLGWGAFAALIALALELDERTDRPPATILLVCVAPILIHPLLLALWWGGLRWINHTVPPTPAVVAVWLGALCLSTWLLRLRPSRVRGATLARAPGAIFFFGLLAVSTPSTLLLVWVIAFALPYLVLLTPEVPEAGSKEHGFQSET